MRYVNCGQCHKTDLPINSSLTIDGISYCEACIQATFTEEQLKTKKVEKEYDPTICSSCQTDFGDTVLNRVARYPLCTSCETSLKDKVFPAWVKAFFAVVIVLVFFSAFWNWRFINGRSSLLHSRKAIENNDYKRAAEDLAVASENVPEVADLRALASYYKGISLLTEDHSVEALAEFNSCKNLVPNDYNIEALIVQAEMGAGFDTKDYAMFLRATKENLKRDTSLAISWAGVASAYACLYATQKSDSLKNLFQYYRSKALSLNDSTEELSVYINRLDHRIETGEILTKNEFDRKFPQGWTKN
ncbi:hypothetical protein [Ohtaekwangia sp.]|uniref:hypothetical protein n=1 Tax=Ohtaekwangia sp. TaxID=2066019 RepID=UPI002F923305